MNGSAWLRGLCRAASWLARAWRGLAFGLWLMGSATLPAAHAARPAAVILWVQAPSDAVAAQAELALWRTLLARLGQTWTEARDARSLNAQLSKSTQPAVLILPHVGTWAARDQRAVQRWQARGTALLVTGGLGLGAEQQGESAAARRLLEAALVALPRAAAGVVPVLQRDGGASVASLGSTPLTKGLDAGTRMLFVERAWVLRPRGEAHAAAEFSQWNHRPVDAAGEPLAAAWYGRRAQGARWAYIGLTLSDLAPVEWASFAEMVSASLTWLGRQDESLDAASVRRADWPPGHRSALLVEMDTELDDAKDVRVLQSARGLAALMAAAGARASFYCVAEDMRRDPALLDELAGAGHELGLHGEVHDPYAGVEPDAQRARVETMWSTWRALRPGAAGGGFRAPYESYDLNTQRALEASGVAYHVSDPNAAPARLPYFADLGDRRRLLNLPRTQPDDQNFRAERQTPETAARLLDLDADAAQRAGALAVLSLHPQDFGPASPMRQALPAWLRRVSSPSRQVWLATGGQIAAWWQERDRVRIMAADDGVRLDVAPGAPVAALSLVLDGDGRGLQFQWAGRPAATVEVLPWQPVRSGAWLQTELRLTGLPAGVSQLTWSRR